MEIIADIATYGRTRKMRKPNPESQFVTLEPRLLSLREGVVITGRPRAVDSLVGTAGLNVWEDDALPDWLDGLRLSSGISSNSPVSSLYLYAITISLC